MNQTQISYLEKKKKELLKLINELDKNNKNISELKEEIYKLIREKTESLDILFFNIKSKSESNEYFIKAIIFLMTAFTISSYAAINFSVSIFSVISMLFAGVSGYISIASIVQGVKKRKYKAYPYSKNKDISDKTIEALLEVKNFDLVTAKLQSNDIKKELESIFKEVCELIKSDEKSDSIQEKVFDELYDQYSNIADQAQKKEPSFQKKLPNDPCEKIILFPTKNQ